MELVVITGILSLSIVAAVALLVGGVVRGNAGPDGFTMETRRK